MPSVAHKPFTKVSDSYKTIISDFLDKSQVESFPNQTRWNPLPLPDDSAPKNFIEGIVTISGAGEPTMKVFYSHG